MSPSARALLLAVAVLGAAGCAGRRTLIEGPSVPELAHVPFFPQTEFHCGPAALATILNAAAIEVTPAELVDLVYIEGLQGSLQAELIAATRRFGRLPVPIEPRLEDLLAELDSGRPVLVLQNLGLARAPVWHYAVAVGFDAAAQRVILRSGEEPRRRERVGRFARQWQLGGSWAFVAAAPHEIPASATPMQYMRALVGSQHQLDATVTATAYATALERWPDEPLVLFLAAAHKHEGAELDVAATLYRRLLALEPEHAAARNNLANVLLEQGCRDEALREARLAAAQHAGAFDAAIADTLQRIESMPVDGVRCTAPGERPVR